MKMADGGFRPAYNCQIVVDVALHTGAGEPRPGTSTSAIVTHRGPTTVEKQNRPAELLTPAFHHGTALASRLPRARLYSKSCTPF